MGVLGALGLLIILGLGGTEGLVSGAAVAVHYSVGIAFGGHHPNLLLYFLQMGQFSPHLHHSAFGGSIFMGSFEIVAVVLLLV